MVDISGTVNGTNAIDFNAYAYINGTDNYTLLGNGTYNSSGSTYRITGENSGHDLKMINTKGDGKGYVQVQDVTISGDFGGNMIGSSSSPFSGTFNGEDYNINGLSINNSSPATNSGLFGYIDGSGSSSGKATVGNANLVSVTVYGLESTGGLAGYTTNVNISNCTVSGTVEGADGSTWYQGVGGLIGKATGGTKMTSSGFTGNSSKVYGSGQVGGLVGWNDGGSTVGDSSDATGGSGLNDCYVSGNVTVYGHSGNDDGGNNVGGYIGNNSGKFYALNQTFTGTVENTADQLGGFVGTSLTGVCWIEGCTDSGTLHAYDTSNSGGHVNDGGIVGNMESGETCDNTPTDSNYWQKNTSMIENSYFTGTLSADNNGGIKCVGGILGSNGEDGAGNGAPGATVWYNTSTLTAPAAGTINGYEFVGGVVGHNVDGYISISELQVKSSVTGGSSGPYVGGMLGAFDNGSGGTSFLDIERSCVTGNVTGYEKLVGGLVGDIANGSSSPWSTTIANCFYNGTMTGSVEWVGGLIGYASATTVTNCYTGGQLYTSNAGYAGGLIAEMTSNCSVTHSFAADTIHDTSTTEVGGLIGKDDDSSSGNLTENGWWTGDGVSYAIGSDHSKSPSYSESSYSDFYRSSLGIYSSWSSSIWSWPGGKFPQLN